MMNCEQVLYEYLIVYAVFVYENLTCYEMI